MDLNLITPWLGAIALIISVGTSVTTFLTSGAKSNARQLLDHERRIQAIEGELKHLPDQQAVHRLELTLKDMQAEIIKIAASADQSARTSARVETYLIENRRGQA